MEALELEGDSVSLRFSFDEVLLIAGATREAQEAVQPWEFGIRTGVTYEEATILGRALRSVRDPMKTKARR